MSTAATKASTLAPHLFGYGYHPQRWWNWRIGTAFFFGEIGAGLFLISLLAAFPPGMALGFIIVVVGKNAAHLLYLGRPARFWRAAMRPDRSWIARGIWATGIFAVTGGLLLAPQYLGWWFAMPQAFEAAILTLAALSALFIMFYDGLVMKASAGLAFWRSNLLPALCLTYAILGGTTLTLTLHELLGRHPAGTTLLMRQEYLFIAINAALLLAYLAVMSRGRLSAREAVQRILRRNYGVYFIGLVVGLGLLATLALLLLRTRIDAPWMAVLIATCEIAGDYTLVMVLLKAAVTAPQTTPSYG